MPDHFFNALLIKDANGYHVTAFLCPNFEEVESMASSWLLQSPADRSAPSFDVPMSGDYKACPPEDTVDADSTMQFNDYSGLYK